MSAESNTHAPERICAFYSKGPHFVRMLKRLRAEYPDEIIVAAIPADFPIEVIERLADETIRFPETAGGASLAGSLQIVRELRKTKCSHMVVMFDSPRLNLLARLSGASKRWCYSVDGRLRPLSQPLTRLMLAPAWLRLCGQMDYHRAKLGTKRRSRNAE
jgi:hypothetical protein